jgi:hypothetical protein
MKQIVHILFLVTFFSASSWAQNSYELTVSTGTYTELASASELIYTPGDGGYYYADNFTFPVFKRSAAFKQQPSPASNGAFLTAQGYIAIYEAPGYTNTIVLQAFFNAVMMREDGITKVSAKVDGTVGNRVVKFQWKNVVLNNDTSAKTNLQVWLHEKDGTISYHYGPSTFPTATTGFTGMVIFKPNFTDLDAAFNVSGKPASPDIIDTISTFAGLNALNDRPANGTIYTFKPAWPLSLENIVDEKATFRAFPNPAKGNIIIETQYATTISIYNITGQLVKSVDAKPGNTTVTTDAMSPGCYILKNNSGSIQTLYIY